MILNQKASPLVDTATTTWPSLRRILGMRRWAASNYAAYQAFLFHSHEFGTVWKSLLPENTLLPVPAVDILIHAVLLLGFTKDI